MYKCRDCTQSQLNILYFSLKKAYTNPIKRMINTFTSITEDWCKIANLKRYRLVNIQFYATSTNIVK